MEDKSVLQLANRMNEIEIEISNLELEYNKIIYEIKRRMPNLENDVNLQKKKVRVNKNAENGKKVR